MTIPRLPTTSYQRHFPGSGEGNNPNIETDGDSLILRRVMIGGKKYDVRIWRWDAKDNLIRLNKGSNFLTETIVEVQDLAKTLFDDQFEDPTEVVLWYEDSGPNGPVCKIDRKSLREGDPGKYMDIAANHPVANLIAQIHFPFFHGQTTTVSAGENQLISPREVQKDPVPSVNEKEDAAAPIKKPKKKKKDPSLPENIRTHLPAPCIESDPTAADRLAATTQKDLAAGPKKKSSSLSLPFSVDVNGTRVTIEDADITRVQGVKAIVNAANPACLGGGGIDGAIHKAAGPALLKECQALPLRNANVRCPTGEAVITGSGNLARQGIEYVIHAVGPVYSPNDPERSAQLLKQAYINALNLAYDNGIQTIAIPAISTGIYGYPVETAARLAIRTVADYAGENPGRFTQIKLLHLGPRAANAAQILDQLQNSPRS